MDEGVGTNNPLAHAEETLPDLLVKDVVLVIDNDPAHAPTWDQIALGEATTSENRYCSCKRGNGNIGLKQEQILANY